MEKCPKCKGSGRINTDICEDCLGTGLNDQLLRLRWRVFIETLVYIATMIVFISGAIIATVNTIEAWSFAFVIFIVGIFFLAFIFSERMIPSVKRRKLKQLEAEQNYLFQAKRKRYLVDDGEVVEKNGDVSAQELIDEYAEDMTFGN